jgi:hypothetical protein
LIFISWFFHPRTSFYPRLFAKNDFEFTLPFSRQMDVDLQSFLEHNKNDMGVESTTINTLIEIRDQHLRWKQLILSNSISHYRFL